MMVWGVPSEVKGFFQAGSRVFQADSRRPGGDGFGADSWPRIVVV